MGKAAAYFLTQRRRGRSAEEVAAVYRAALQQAFTLSKVRDVGAGAKGAAP